MVGFWGKLLIYKYNYGDAIIWCQPNFDQNNKCVPVCATMLSRDISLIAEGFCREAML